MLSDKQQHSVARVGRRKSTTADNTGPFSKAGDSGSGIVNRDQELVGLLFAGTETQTLANPIQLVLNALKTALGVKSLDVVT